MNLLVTGGAGFIGSHFVRLARQEGHAVTVLDAFTYAGDMARLADWERVISGDVADPIAVSHAVGVARPDAVVNFAAESHVARAARLPGLFVHSNVLGVQVLIDAVLQSERPCRFVQVSTDEVYGNVTGEPADETRALAPRNAYAATKAAAEHLVMAAHHTHGLDAVITRGGNNYGLHQHEEKLIPCIVGQAVRGEPLTVHGTGAQVRQWVHASDHVAGIMAALERGKPGGVYNLASDERVTVADMVVRIADILDVDHKRIVHVPDRPGQDMRYAIDSTKARRELGWAPAYQFDYGLEQTVLWYADRFRRAA